MLLTVDMSGGGDHFHRGESSRRKAVFEQGDRSQNNAADVL